jgi:uncharacterized protein
MSMHDAHSLPLFPLGTVLYPGMILPLRVFEERYRRLMRDQRDDDPIFGVVLIRSGREVGDEPEIHAIGTAASLVGARRYADGTYDVVVRGGARFRASAGDWSRGYLVCSVEWLDEPLGDSASADVLVGRVRHAYDRFLDAIVRSIGAVHADVAWPSAPTDFAYELCARLPFDTRERQRLLEAESTVGRLAELERILIRERTLLVEAGASGATIVHPGFGFSPN